jgi:hypothetical protein
MLTNTPPKCVRNLPRNEPIARYSPETEFSAETGHQWSRKGRSSLNASRTDPFKRVYAYEIRVPCPCSHVCRDVVELTTRRNLRQANAHFDSRR